MAGWNRHLATIHPYIQQGPLKLRTQLEQERGYGQRSRPRECALRSLCAGKSSIFQLDALVGNQRTMNCPKRSTIAHERLLDSLNFHMKSLQ